MWVDSDKKLSDKISGGETIMSIEKKSLISTLKTTKKANIAGVPVVDSGARKETVFNQKDLKMRSVQSLKSHQLKTLKSHQLRSLRQASTKAVNQ
jgi:hypothetical protein